MDDKKTDSTPSSDKPITPPADTPAKPDTPPAPTVVEPTPSASTPVAPATTPASDPKPTPPMTTTPMGGDKPAAPAMPMVSGTAPGVASSNNPMHDAMSSHGTSASQASHGMSDSSSKKKPIMMVVMAAVILILLAVAGYLFLQNSDGKAAIDSLQSQVATLDSNTHDLPEGAVKVSECIPNMGFHYLTEGSDPRFGPYYLVSNEGKIIGFEFMFSDDMFTTIPDAGIPLDLLITDGPLNLNDWQYNSIDFSIATAGHPGFEEPHTDVHLYTVTPEEQKLACQ